MDLGSLGGESDGCSEGPLRSSEVVAPDVCAAEAPEGFGVIGTEFRRAAEFCYGLRDVPESQICSAETDVGDL